MGAGMDDGGWVSGCATEHVAARRVPSTAVVGTFSQAGSRHAVAAPSVLSDFDRAHRSEEAFALSGGSTPGSSGRRRIDESGRRRGQALATARARGPVAIAREAPLRVGRRARDQPAPAPWRHLVRPRRVDHSTDPHRPMLIDGCWPPAFGKVHAPSRTVGWPRGPVQCWIIAQDELHESVRVQVCDVRRSQVERRAHVFAIVLAAGHDGGSPPRLRQPVLAWSSLAMRKARGQCRSTLPHACTGKPRRPPRPLDEVSDRRGGGAGEADPRRCRPAPRRVLVDRVRTPAEYPRPRYLLRGPSKSTPRPWRAGHAAADAGVTVPQKSDAP